jgi:hypothetical protein
MAPELFNEQKFWIDRGGNNNGIDLTTWLNICLPVTRCWNNWFRFKQNYNYFEVPFSSYTGYPSSKLKFHITGPIQILEFIFI